MSRFTLPRDIYYGANALENLKNLKGSRAVLVLGGGSMKKFGFVDKALGYLKDAYLGMRVRREPSRYVPLGTYPRLRRERRGNRQQGAIRGKRIPYAGIHLR